jgi:hypothetical protein
MGSHEYREAYEKAATELEGLLKGQEQTERRILALRKTMNVLSTLIEQEGDSANLMDSFHAITHNFINNTLTNDIQKIVGLSLYPLTTSEVRDELNKLGSLLVDHTNPLATVNAILNRLAEGGRIEETVKDGKKAWRAVDAQKQKANRLAQIKRELRQQKSGMPPPPKFEK